MVKNIETQNRTYSNRENEHFVVEKCCTISFFRNIQKWAWIPRKFSENSKLSKFQSRFFYFKHCDLFWNSKDLKNINIKEMASNLDMVNTMQTFGGHMQIRYAAYRLRFLFFQVKNDRFGWLRGHFQTLNGPFRHKNLSLEFNLSEILFKNCQNV